MFKKFIIILILPLLLLACKTEENPDIDRVLKEFDGLSLEEAIETLKNQNDQYQKFITFFKIGSFDNEVKKYTKEEELYGELPEFMSPDEVERQSNEYLNGIYMIQEYKYPQTEIKIRSEAFGIKASLTYQANCIYFHDGSVDTVKQKLREWMDLDTPKVIDSISVTAYYSYATEYDSYTVKDKLDIEGGSIKIVKKKDNVVTVHLDGSAAKYNKIVALNDNEDVLSFSSSSEDTKDADKVIKLYAKAFDKLVKKADDFKSVEELKAAVKKTIAKLPPIYDTKDATCIYNGYFKGNINSIIVYIPKDKVSKQIDFTLINSRICNQDLIYTQDTETRKYGFMSQSGEFVIKPTYADLNQINDLYYYTKKDGDNEVYTFYYLDINNKELVIIPNALDINYASPVCVLVEKNEKYALWGSEGKPIPIYILRHI